MSYTYEFMRNFGNKLTIKEFEDGKYHGWHFVDRLIEIKNDLNKMIFQKEKAIRMLNWLKENHPELLI